MREYAFKCDKCGRGTNSTTNGMRPWCYNKWKKQERINRKLKKKQNDMAQQRREETVN